jgi:hypothetical protein
MWGMDDVNRNAESAELLGQWVRPRALDQYSHLRPPAESVAV